MKPQPKPQSKKKRPHNDFRKTATGFILNGKHVTVEYKTRREGVAPPVAQ